MYLCETEHYYRYNSLLANYRNGGGGGGGGDKVTPPPPPPKEYTYKKKKTKTKNKIGVVMLSQVVTYFLLLILAVSAQTFNPLRIPIDLGRNSCPSTNGFQSASDQLAALVAAIRPVSECGGGWWKEVVSLNMTDPSQQCPSGWTLNSEPRACARPENSEAGCSLVTFPVGLSYTRVCGRISGSLVGDPDSFATFGQRNPINYLDGISLVRSSQETKELGQHIWSFAADKSREPDFPPPMCPCSGVSIFNSSFPSFVGNNYFCDLYPGNGLLWDGQDCVSALSCCNFNNPPWFSVEISKSAENIEARICTDEIASNERIFVEALQIFIQ